MNFPRMGGLAVAQGPNYKNNKPQFVDVDYLDNADVSRMCHSLMSCLPDPQEKCRLIPPFFLPLFNRRRFTKSHTTRPLGGTLTTKLLDWGFPERFAKCKGLEKGGELY